MCTYSICIRDWARACTIMHWRIGIGCQLWLPVSHKASLVGQSFWQMGAIMGVQYLSLGIHDWTCCLKHHKWCSLCDLVQIFFTSKFSYVLFCNPTHKTEIGRANKWGTTNSKLPGPIIMMGQLETLNSHSIIFHTLFFMAIMNQQPLMHQLAILSTRWPAFFHSTLNGVHHSPFFFIVDHCTFLGGFVLGCFSPRPDLTHNYPTHLPTLISIVPTLIPY